MSISVLIGLPPARSKVQTRADSFSSSALLEIAATIRHGEYVQALPIGSTGKLANLIKDRGLVVVRRNITPTNCDAYVVSQGWYWEHPEVGYTTKSRKKPWSRDRG